MTRPDTDQPDDHDAPSHDHARTDDPQPQAEPMTDPTTPTPETTSGVSLFDLPIHPAANLLPMLPEAELQRLADDIAAHGLQQSIVVWQGQVLDGRNRLAACRLAGVEPTPRYLPACDDPVAYVLSTNLHRRHLSESQRAAIAAEAMPLLSEQAKARQAAAAVATNAKLGRGDGTVSADLREASGKASEQAAALVNVSPRSVETAAKVKREGVPELFEAVKRGEVAASAAAEVASLPADEQRAAVAEGKVAAVAKAKRTARKPRPSTPPPPVVQPQPSPVAAPSEAADAAPAPSAPPPSVEALAPTPEASAEAIEAPVEPAPVAVVDPEPTPAASSPREQTDAEHIEAALAALAKVGPGRYFAVAQAMIAAGLDAAQAARAPSVPPPPASAEQPCAAANETTASDPGERRVLLAFDVEGDEVVG